jgi:hypothetical protein
VSSPCPRSLPKHTRTIPAAHYADA